MNGTASANGEARPPLPYVGEEGGLLRLGNDLVELGFDLNATGALVSLLAKATGSQLIRDAEAPRTLFRVATADVETRELNWLDAREATRCEWSTREAEGGLTVTIAAWGFPSRALRVEVDVALDASSSLSRWRVRVTGLDHGEALAQLVCPIVSGVMKVGEPAPGECLAVPIQGEGFLFRNPYPMVDRLPLRAGAGPDTPGVGVGEWHGRYPGQIPVQLMLYYSDRAGLYMAAHDAGQHAKAFDVAPMADWGPFPVMSVSHLPGEQPGADVSFQYDTVVGVFSGDWYDGADIYKAWARQQWWCGRKLAERDIPEWLRNGFGVFQMSNYHVPVLGLNHSLADIADTVNELSRDIGVPLLALIFNFEGGGAWTGPIGFLPPREGEEAFRNAMQRLREAGNYGFVYMPGGNWYIAISSYEPPFDSRPEFERDGRPNAVMNAQGEVNIGTWYVGWEATRLCPQTEYTREITAQMLLGAVERGCPVVQIDNFPCGGADACYDPSHGHPLGPGPWWSDAWGRILADVRRQARALDPDCALTTEGISEGFIPYLDLYDQRAGNMEYFGHWQQGMPMGAEPIPLFGYIYSGYIGAYLAAMPECNRPEVLYWTRCLGKALTQGVVPTTGKYFPEPQELNPVTLGFFKQVVRAAANECWKYIMFGEMLRSPEIDVPTITASYLKFVLLPGRHEMDPSQRHEVHDFAVQHSAWRAEDGSIGYLFANVSEDPVSFDVELSHHGDETPTWDVNCVTDGTGSALHQSVGLPRRIHVEMAPLSVTVVECRPHVEQPVAPEPGEK